MIFTDLLNACVVRLAGAEGGDAFFTDPDTGVAVLAENKIDLGNELDAQLARLGMGVVVAITRIADAGSTQGLVVVNVVFQVHEIPAINRNEGGTLKSALDVATKIISLIKEWTPNEGAWHRFEFASYELIDADENFGRITWQVTMVTGTILETVALVLADASGRAIGNENGEAMLTSPTPA